MAENDGLNGKNLALNEFRQAILDGKEEIENGKDGNTKGKSIELPIGKQILKVDIEKIENEEKYKINILGEHILTLEDNELSFTDGWEEKLGKKIEEFKDNINGEDLINSLKEMEQELEREKEQRDKEEQSIDEEEKDEEDLSKDEEEKDNPEKEEKTEDKEKQELAKKYHTNASNVVNLSQTRRIAGKENLGDLVKDTKTNKRTYMVRDEKDIYKSHMIGIDKDGKQKETDLKHSKGKNPDITIKLIEDDKITKKRPVEYYAIDNRQGLARVIEDGRDTWVYVRQEEGRGKEFQGVKMPRKDTRGPVQNSKDVRDAMDYRYNSGRDLANRADAMEKQAEYEKLRRKINGRRGSSTSRSIRK